ncbi:MAG TPA: DNA polymerase II large subunit [Euryarchaeota archaeon]|nr:DNA polymerase II large subunit [Euryarchaeota archaeon]
MRQYFDALREETDRCYSVARAARAKGLDPVTEVEIPQAEDLASRVEKLLSDWDTKGIADRIRELSKNLDREEVSIQIAKELANRPARTREESIDRAVRVGVAVLTEGILVAPLEGIASVKINKNSDGTEYLSIYFSGPIRSAGGTGQAMSVLIADIVRRELGINEYKPTEGEVQRWKEEIPLYKTCQHLQYSPGNEEIDLVARNIPVCIDGEGTEDKEISGFRDLPRIETNRVRGGGCLVFAEGLCLKAPKLQKHVKRLKIDGWDFLDQLLLKRDASIDASSNGIAPSSKFLKDIVAGRPVLSHPSRIGGFRLRYGRSRANGLAAVGMNPATMTLLGEFIAVGTQVKLERPGKAGAVTPCDSIEGPIVLLDNGDLVQVDTISGANAVAGKIGEIVDVGEILIPFGEFAENNHPLVPVGLTLEEYIVRLKSKTQDVPEDILDPSLERSIELSREYDMPLHPKFNLFWSDLSMDELLRLRNHLIASGEMRTTLHLENDPDVKKVLELLGALHSVKENEISIDERYSDAMLLCLGLQVGEDGRISERVKLPGSKETLSAVSEMSGAAVAPRAMTRIGARMARPEKAKERKMKPPPHVLFPLGQAGGAQRLVNEAAKKGEIEISMGERRCPVCGMTTFLAICECGSHTVARGTENIMKVPLRELLDGAFKRLNISMSLDIKGVKGMISRDKIPEPLEKGVLRAKNGLFVFKDGTTRFDTTDVPLTHFRPSEIGLNLDDARRLGYDRDIHGMELENEDQICELRVQDIIVPSAGAEYLLRVAKFVDDLLIRFYGLPAFYGAEKIRDMVGHLVVGLAPHTSGGVLARVIGFSDVQAGYAHPYFHAAKRRNCDGDEDSIILLMDALLNFSRSFLPERRGGLMDAPLVLTMRLDPDEIDKEAHNLDFRSEYPVELYDAALKFAHPKSVEGIMDLAGGRIGTVLQYEGFGYTHEIDRIDAGPKSSAYTSFGSMDTKIEAQLAIAKKIRAVDANDVVHRVITRHLLPDLIGSLKSFSTQQLRCPKCNRKYRRMPLRGRCECGHALVLTVPEGGVSKYLEKAKEIADRFDVPRYTRQRIELVETSINSLFTSDRVKDSRLDDFM